MEEKLGKKTKNTGEFASYIHIGVIDWIKVLMRFDKSHLPYPQRLPCCRWRNTERFKETFVKSKSLEVTSIEKLKQLLLGDVSILELSTCNRENYSSGSPSKKRYRNVVQPKFHYNDVGASSAAGSSCINDGIGASSDGDFDVNFNNGRQHQYCEEGSPQQAQG